MAGSSRVSPLVSLSPKSCSVVQDVTSLTPALAGRAFSTLLILPTCRERFSMGGSRVVILAQHHRVNGMRVAALRLWINGDGETITWMDAFVGNIPGSMVRFLRCLSCWRVWFWLTARIALGALMVWLSASSWLRVWWTGLALKPTRCSRCLLTLALCIRWRRLLVLSSWQPTQFLPRLLIRVSGAYGILIGVMTVGIRVLNPAYPEGIMLAILFANLFAPLFDFVVKEQNIKRRQKRTLRWFKWMREGYL